MAEQTVSNEINALEVQAFELPLFRAMRRLQQDAEVHAKRLARYGGLSPVQLMIPQVLAGEGQMTASALSRRVSLTARDAVRSARPTGGTRVAATSARRPDRRRQWLLLSDSGRELLQDAPALLPPEFRTRSPRCRRGAPRADGGLAACRRACGDME